MKRKLSIFPKAKLPRYLATVVLIGLLLACTTNEEDPIPRDLTVTLSPNDAEIPQEGLIRITATTSPSVTAPLVFQWSTGGNYGGISDGVSHTLFEEETRNGSSYVEYVAHPVANTGGTDKITVEIFNSLGESINSDEISIKVKPHEPQLVTGVNHEYKSDGSIPGRTDILFISAFIFKKLPGFTRYKFTVVEPAGEGWNVGPVGTTFVHSLRGALLDREQFVNAYGSDIFGLGTDKIALIGAGPEFGNYDPTDTRRTENLQKMRDHAANRLKTVYSVEPAI